MLEIEKYKLSTYRVIETLRKTQETTVELVESDLDSQRYIRKTYNSDKRTVYGILKQLENPNLPKVYEVFFGESTIVIEQYIEGKTLDRMIDEKYRFSKAELRKVIDGLSNALLGLHDRSIIHRDVKPGNIIIRPNGDAVLIDFGIARIYSPARADDTEHFGTAGYAAPEQFGFAQSDCRTDIYALGITLQAIASKQNAPRYVQQAIARCTEFDPHKRFQSIEELRSFLKTGGRGRQKKRILAAFLSAAAVLALWCIVSRPPEAGQTPPADDPDAAFGITDSSTETHPQETDALLLEMTEDRIVDVSGAEEIIPCLQLKDDREHLVKVSLGTGVPEITVKAQLVDTFLKITIDDTAVFLFHDDSGLSTASYPGGKTFSEIILYDMNGDGIDELIPVMCNALRAEWADGSVVRLKNYSLAWCIYYDNGVFQCAEEKMTARLDPFLIYGSMPGCIHADFPFYYTLENGKLVQRS